METFTDDRENALDFKKIKSERDYFSNIIQNAPGLICGIDKDGVTTFINPIVTRITGYSKDELLGKKWWEILYPGEEYEQVKRLFKAFSKGELIDYEMRLTCKNGDKKYLLWSSYTKRDKNNNVLEVFGFGIDVTERKAIEERLRINEERLELAMFGANDGVWDWDLETDNLHFDSRYFTMAGYEPGEFPGLFKEWEKRVHPDDIRQAKSAIEQYLAGEKGVYEIEFRFLRKQGDYMWMRGRGRVVARNEQGYPVRFIGTHSDITAQKKAEEALRESKQLLGNILESIQDGILVLDGDTKYSYWNRRMEEISRAKREDVLGTTPWETFPFLKGDVAEAMKKGMRGEVSRNKELQYTLSDGTIGWTTESYFPLKDSDGKTAGIVGVINDITHRKRAEEKLRVSEANYRTIFDSVYDGIFVHDMATGAILDVNKRSMEMFGYTYDEFFNLTVEDLSLGELSYTQENAAEWIHKAVTLGPQTFDWICKRKNGETFWAEVTLKRAMIADHERVLAAFRDIAKRKRVEAKLKRVQSYISNIIDSMPSVLIGVDNKCNVTQWNKRAEEITGISADTAQGQPVSKVFPSMAPEMEQILKSIRTGETIHKQNSTHLSENGTCYENVTIYPLDADGMEGAVIRIDDVTEKMRMEEMMIQSEKMLSVGGLAAGMAHEINNPLAGMLQNADVMANRLCKNIDMPANLKAAEAAGVTMAAIRNFMEARGIPAMITTIMESGRRISSIVSNMLSFARKSDAAASSQNLTELLDKTLELAATDYDLKKQYDFKRIAVLKEYEENLPPVPCEGGKIQQVLLNILRNGAHAMQEGETGKPRFIVRTRFEKGRKMVSMEIEDNGPGMDETTRKRVFEPFYTTKSVGVGTGLGLSVSYFIITENHSGEMTVESSPGKGARFIIRLPIETTRQ